MFLLCKINFTANNCMLYFILCIHTCNLFMYLCFMNNNFAFSTAQTPLSSINVHYSNHNLKLGQNDNIMNQFF